MKRPVWRYSLEVESNAPLALVRAKLESMADALPLSVFAPRLGGRGPRAWRQDQFQPLLWKVGLLGWRSEALLLGFIKSLP